MRPFFLRENVRSRTTFAFLAATLVIASIQLISKYHTQAGRNRRTTETSDVFLLTSLNPRIASWSRPSKQSFRPATKHSEETKTDSSGSQFIITQRQRSLHIVYRLSRFSGNGRGFSRVSHLIVSLVGVLGMFSAIIGALIGPWLADTGEDSADDDRFAYWVRDEEDEEDEERTCGIAREEKHIMYRILDIP